MNLSTWNQTSATKLIQVPNPELLAFMADSPGGYASTVPSALSYGVVPRHDGFANVSFVDGHVEAFAGSYLGCGVGEIEEPDVRWNLTFRGSPGRLHETRIAPPLLRPCGLRAASRSWILGRMSGLLSSAGW